MEIICLLYRLRSITLAVGWKARGVTASTIAPETEEVGVLDGALAEVGGAGEVADDVCAVFFVRLLG